MSKWLAAQMADIKYKIYSSIMLVGQLIFGLCMGILFIFLLPVILFSNYFEREDMRYKKEHPGG